MSDVYVVVHIAATCDDSTTYVTKDATEMIEFAWSIVDATSLTVIHSDSCLVRPVNTPITPYCQQLHRISWEHVRNAGSFKDAMSKFDSYVQENLISQNKDFSLVTFDVSKLRVQLPREARDKSVVLPPYLQHPRVFDLQSEYVKWQKTHPEALSYTASSLSNMVTALEVEVENSDDIAKAPSSSSSTPPPHANNPSQAESDSKDAVLEKEETKSKSTVTLYSKLLIQLAKKSLPVEEHPSVLVKPYDSSQDVRVFLAERSKILYLSNLPGDTTQSELEFWFTQYGGRPIAFWTLKNSDTEKSSNKRKGISGFAVFATHEEATESLSMNGRALNDRAIEVQASSTRVLDKASELLTPFPPSKNRHRPGDWTCPSCGFSNFQRRTHCFRCSFPASSAVAIQESIYSNNHVGPRRNNNSNNGSSNNNPSASSQAHDKIAMNAAVVNAAAVLKSTSFNSTSFQDNQGLYSSNLGSSLNSNNPVSNNDHVNQNHHGNNHNNRSHYGNNVPFRAGDWKCEVCVYHNFAKNLCCLKCGAAKPVMNVNSHQNNNMHSVNSTAAAIAAATASGQPLNMTNGFMGLQQPQPHQVGHQSRHNSVSSGNGHYSNNNNNSNQKSHQFHYNNSGLRGSSSGTPQPILSQQLMLLQQQQSQHQQHSQSQSQNQGSSHQMHNHPQLHQQYGSQKYSPGASNSPGLYASYSNQQSLNHSYFNKNGSVGSYSNNLSNGEDKTVQAKGMNDASPSLNLLSNQINSLSLNN